MGSIGLETVGTSDREADFLGCISEVSIFAYEKTPAEVAQSDAVSPTTAPSLAPTEICSSITVTCGTFFDGVYSLRDTTLHGRVSYESASGEAMLFSMEFDNHLSHPGLRWVFTRTDTDTMLVSAATEIDFPSSDVWLELTDSLKTITEHKCAGTISCSNTDTTIPQAAPTGISPARRSLSNADNGYQWSVQDSTNCYPSSNGADEHSCCPRSSYTIQTFESCQKLCIDTPGCDGITISDAAPRKCYLRHNLVLNNCVSNSAGWTSAKVSESDSAPIPAPAVPVAPVPATTGMTARCRTCLDSSCPGTEDPQWWSCRECVQLCAVSWIIENPSLIPWLPGRRKLSDAAKSWSCAISGRSPGSSFGEVFVSSMDECRASCESVKGCKAIIWRRSIGSCYRLDRFYETKYEEAFDDAQVANYGIDQSCDVFSEAAAQGTCLRKKINDIGMVLGNHPHTIQVRLSFPDSAPTMRQWILNLGQPTTGAHHWLWRSDLSGQIGAWNGDQVNSFDISACTYLTTTSSGSMLKLYCDGTLLGQRSANFDIKTPELSIGLETVGTSDREADFLGCVSEVSIFAYEKSPAEVAQSDAVFGKIPECLDCHLNECNLWTMDQFNPESCRMCILTHCGGSENSQSTALPGLFLPGLLPNPDSDMLPSFPDTFPLPGRRELRNSVNDLTKASDASEDESLADKELSPSDTEVAPITRRLLRLILGQD